MFCFVLFAVIYIANEDGKKIGRKNCCWAKEIDFEDQREMCSLKGQPTLEPFFDRIPKVVFVF